MRGAASPARPNRGCGKKTRRGFLGATHPPGGGALFGSIGGSELIVLAAIGLLVFGPRRLPEMGRALAGWMNEFRRAAGEMKAAIDREASLGDVRKAAGDLHDTIRREAGKAMQEFEAEAGGVKAGLTAGEEPKGEPGGPAVP